MERKYGVSFFDGITGVHGVNVYAESEEQAELKASTRMEEICNKRRMMFEEFSVCAIELAADEPSPENDIDNANHVDGYDRDDIGESPDY